MHPQDLASAVRGAHTLTPAIKCCLRHMPALALRRYAIPLKTYACAKTLQKTFPATAINCAVLPTVAHGACPFLSSTKRAIRIGKIILPHSHKSENAKKSTCPAKHTNGILARPCHARRQSAPNAHFGGIAYNTLPRCAPSFYETETKSPQGKLPANKQSAQKETPAHCRHAFFGRPRQHAPHYFLRRFADCAE